jgi:hypothetical protein
MSENQPTPPLTFTADEELAPPGTPVSLVIVPSLLDQEFFAIREDGDTDEDFEASKRLLAAILAFAKSGLVRACFDDTPSFGARRQAIIQGSNPRRVSFATSIARSLSDASMFAWIFNPGSANDHNAPPTAMPAPIRSTTSRTGKTKALPRAATAITKPMRENMTSPNEGARSSSIS